MIGWLIETILTTTVLLMLVLALRGPVARMFGAGWAYALWAVPAVRLVLPPLPALTPDIVLPVAAFIPAAVGSAAPPPVHAGPGQWVPLMLAIWAGGAVIFMILQWLAYREFLHRLGASARPARPPSYGGILTLISQAVEGPLALGLFSRRIVLPADFLRRYNIVERRLALEHELTHHRRGDIWWNMVATLVLALNWFNPVAWIAFRAFRADQELSCDAVVAARASDEERCDYARALVKSASRPGLIGACALNSASALKLRLRMMRCHRVSALRSVGGFGALALFTTAGFAIGAPDHVAAETAPGVAAIAPAPSRPVVTAVVDRAPTQVATGPTRAAPDPTRRPHKPRRARAQAGRSAPAAAEFVNLVATPATAALAPSAPAVAALPEATTAPAPRPRVVRIVRSALLRVHGGPASESFLVMRSDRDAALEEVEATVERLRTIVGGQGGSVRTEAVAQIIEGKAKLRGYRLRAPDLWKHEGSECIK